VVNVTSISTLLVPQFLKHVVLGWCVRFDTVTDPEHAGEQPTRTLRLGGVSLLETLSNASDGMLADAAPEKMLEQVVPLTNPGRFPQAFNKAGAMLAVGFVRKSNA
jgi:hypothetical protein